jgi:hypothetical protein
MQLVEQFAPPPGVFDSGGSERSAHAPGRIPSGDGERRRDVIVETAAFVVGDEQRGARPSTGPVIRSLISTDTSY